MLRQFAHAAKVATLDDRLKRPLKSTKNRRIRVHRRSCASGSRLTNL
jgi:hypothetical protein